MKKLILAAILGLSCLCINAFEIRGLHIDMRREVMTLQALKDIASSAAADGHNVIIMEWEASFPFEENATLCNEEAFTREEVREFIGHCTSLGIDVIPLQNCFGHCDYILKHERYSALREEKNDFTQVCPSKTGLARETFESIFADVASLHPSKYFHIGADETGLLGHCRECAAKCREEGVSKLYCDYVSVMCELVHNLGKTPVIWADMLEDHPEAVKDLPDDLVVIDWDYTDNPMNYVGSKALNGSGLEVWGATALRSYPDEVHCTNWMYHFKNYEYYSEYARQEGFNGLINTSWATSGKDTHLLNTQGDWVKSFPRRQPYPMSGFNILQKAFTAAANSENGFKTLDFIAGYCRDTFGLDEDGVRTMIEYFTLPQNNYKQGKAKGPEEELEESLRIQSKVHSLKARRGKKEMAQLKLMLDIHVNYLKFFEVKLKYESPAFRGADASVLAEELRPVVKEGDRLRKRFFRLNKDVLKAPGKLFEEPEYLAEMHSLYNRLAQ